MDSNLKTIYELKNEKLKKNFERNGIECLFFNNKEELLNYLEPYFKEDKSAAVGGSQTLFETGIIDLLRKSPVQFYDRYQEGLSPKEIDAIFHQSFFVDYYLTSSNAVDLKGNLYNVDGNGNRVAAMIYGPKKVFVVIGKNKIFEDEQGAIKHIQTVSTPANAMRLHKNTPCIKTGMCVDCQSEDRLCYAYTKIAKQKPGRMSVLVVNEDLGY